jgi:ribosomal protein S18 acetylase RimI-like enzyme
MEMGEQQAEISLEVRTTKDHNEVSRFLAGAGDSLSSFRYFDKRPVEQIKSHIVTLLGYLGDEPVAYGHLEEENRVVWLGVCVSQAHKGKGFGSSIVDELISSASSKGVREIRLSVDSSNAVAKKLYESRGFENLSDNGVTTFYERINMDTIGGLLDKLTTVNLKMWNNQELLYEIRRMTFDEFKSKYFSAEDGAEKLWTCLKKACDLNVQRNDLVDEIDERLVELATKAAAGEDLGAGFVQRKHKTY